MERKAEEVFARKLEAGTIAFKLVAPPDDNLNWKIEEVLEERIAPGERKLERDHKPLERSLFEVVYEKHLNPTLERPVALHLDDRAVVRWWHRIAARREWGLQGWLRHKVYPDFLVWLCGDNGTGRVLVVESKGDQLSGADTPYKRKFFELLEGAFARGREVGSVELFEGQPESMQLRIIMQSTWNTELASLLDGGQVA